MSTEMRGFFERIERLGGTPDLAGKPASLFASAPTLGGGTESAMHSAVALLAHLGMVLVPMGFDNLRSVTTSTSEEFGQGSMDEGHGGSPFGASTIEGRDGSREPSELELKLARFQGEHCGRIHLQSSFVAGASTYHGSTGLAVQNSNSFSMNLI